MKIETRIDENEAYNAFAVLERYGYSKKRYKYLFLDEGWYIFQEITTNLVVDLPSQPLEDNTLDTMLINTGEIV